MKDILEYVEEDDFDEVLESLDDDELELLDDDEAGSELEEMDMTEARARELTESIRSAAAVTFILLAEAHEKGAHKALGYATWADYVKEEFDMSAQRSYQLLDLSRVTNEIESAVPEGTVVKITEAQARDIKRELPRVTEKIKEAIDAGESPEEAVDRTIEEIREQKKADDKVIAEKQKALEESEEEGYRAGLESAADAILENNPLVEEEAKNYVEVETDGPNLSPEDTMSLYNFFNVLNGISSLPEPDDFVSVIPLNRASEVNQQLEEAQKWINRFAAVWEAHLEEPSEED